MALIIFILVGASVSGGWVECFLCFCAVSFGFFIKNATQKYYDYLWVALVWT